MKQKPLVIAHRGACGYLPEHSLAGKALAFGMGADYVELDALLTRDDVPIVFHDHYLDAMTNVAELYPDRRRKDGLHYAVDFTLEEIKKLRLHERVDPATGRALHPGRFPAESAVHFEIPTLEEEIDFIQGLNKSMAMDVGFYIEPKGPAYHSHEGKDIGKAVIDAVQRFGYRSRDSRCVIQSFEPQCIRYMRETLKSDLPMVQLIGDVTWEETPGVDYGGMVTPRGLDEVATYADQIGPWINQVVIDRGKGSKPGHTRLVEWAHERDLAVNPYTFRADDLPSYAGSFDELLEIFIFEMKVDGIFTDFPDRALRFFAKKGL